MSRTPWIYNPLEPQEDVGHGQPRTPMVGSKDINKLRSAVNAIAARLKARPAAPPSESPAIGARVERDAPPTPAGAQYREEEEARQDPNAAEEESDAVKEEQSAGEEHRSTVDADDDIKVGTVSNTGNLFSLIACPDPGLAKKVLELGLRKKVYAHRTVMSSWEVQVHDVVAFKVKFSGGEGPVGSPSACHPVWKLMGHANDDGEHTFRRYAEHEGCIYQDDSSGNLFVECTAVRDQYGRDASLDQSVFDEMKLRVGDIIAFRASVASAGDAPTITAPLWKRLSNIEDNSSDHRSPKKPRMADRHTAYKSEAASLQDSVEAPVEMAGEGPLPLPGVEGVPSTSMDLPEVDGKPEHLSVGCVKSIGPQYAFITVPWFDGDVYVSGKNVNIKELTKSDIVICRVEDVAEPKGGKVGTAPFCKLLGWDNAQPVKFGEYTGTVGPLTSSGSTFIKECPEIKEKHGYDAFVHHTTLTRYGIQPGDRIGFTLHLNSNQRPQVAWRGYWKYLAESDDLSLAKAGSASESLAAENVDAVMEGAPGHNLSTGVVVKIGSGNYAYVRVDGLSRDVMVHGNTVQLQHLALSDVLMLGMEDEGRGPKAKHPVWKLIGDPGAAQSASFGQYIGRLKKLVGNGGGFVDCLPVYSDTHYDAFVTKALVESGGLQIGDVLAFSFHINAMKKPQVDNACWKCVSSGPPVSLGLASATLAKTTRSDQEAASGVKDEKLVLAEPVSAPSNRDPGARTNAAADLQADEAAVQELQFGIVSAVTTTGGWVQVGNVDRGAFVPAGIAKPTCLKRQDQVYFSIHDEGKGPRARHPFWKLVGEDPTGARTHFGEYIGQVKKLMPTGSGFIDCPAVRDKHGYDVHVGSEQVQQCELSVGDVLAFSMRVNQFGRPVLEQPCWKCLSVGAPVLLGASPSAWTAKTFDAGEAVSEDRSGIRVKEESGASHRITQERNPKSVTFDPRSAELDLTGGVVESAGPSDWSFVHVSDSPKSVFLHGNIVDPQLLAPDDILMFRMHVVGKGPKAKHPVWKLVGHEEGSNAVAFGEYIGRVKKFNRFKQIAYIECPAIHEAHGVDATIGSHAAQDCDLNVGDLIAFALQFNANGKPEVRYPCWKCVSLGDPLPLGSAEASLKPKAATSGGEGLSSRPIAPLPYIKQKPRELQVGRVARVGPAYSHVTVPGCGYGSDVYVHKSIIIPSMLEEKDIVMCSIQETDQGYPQGTHPLWKLVGWEEIGDAVTFGDFVGRCSADRDGEGGTVDCAAVVDKFGSSASLSSSTIAACGLAGDDIIAFSVHLDADGLPTVLPPVWKSYSPKDSIPALSGAEQDGAKRQGVDKIEATKDVKRSAGTKRPRPESAEGGSESARTPTVVSSGQGNKVDNLHIGRVKLKGFNFSWVDGGCKDDIFAHKSIVPPESVAVEDIIAFKIINDKHRLQTSSPVWKLIGCAEDKGAVAFSSFGQFIGRVGDVSTSGPARLDCREVQELHGKGATINSALLAEGDISVGDIIAFKVEVSSSGVPMVLAPYWKKCSPCSTFDSRFAVEPPRSRGRQRVRVLTKPPDLQLGWVRSTSRKGHYSVVHSPDSGYPDEDVQVRGDDVDPATLDEGNAVLFKLIDDQGQFRAGHPLWKFVGKAVGDKPVKFGDYIGTIRNKAAGGHAYLDCPAIFDTHGSDTFMHEDDADASGLAVGETVAFSWHIDLRGKPRVDGDSCWRCCSPQEHAPPPTPPGHREVVVRMPSGDAAPLLAAKVEDPSDLPRTPSASSRPPKQLPRPTPGSEQMPKQMPEQMPKRMPKQTPKQTPKPLPKQTPKQIPARPKQLPKQMPKQLPKKIRQPMARLAPNSATTPAVESDNHTGEGQEEPLAAPSAPAEDVNEEYQMHLASDSPGGDEQQQDAQQEEDFREAEGWVAEVDEGWALAEPEVEGAEEIVIVSEDGTAEFGEETVYEGFGTAEPGMETVDEGVCGEVPSAAPPEEVVAVADPRVSAAGEGFDAAEAASSADYEGVCIAEPAVKTIEDSPGTVQPGAENADGNGCASAPAVETVSMLDDELDGNGGIGVSVCAARSIPPALAQAQSKVPGPAPSHWLPHQSPVDPPNWLQQGSAPMPQWSGPEPAPMANAAAPSFMPFFPPPPGAPPLFPPRPPPHNAAWLPPGQPFLQHDSEFMQPSLVPPPPEPLPPPPESTQLIPVRTFNDAPWRRAQKQNPQGQESNQQSGMEPVDLTTPETVDPNPRMDWQAGSLFAPCPSGGGCQQPMASCPSASHTQVPTVEIPISTPSSSQPSQLPAQLPSDTLSVESSPNSSEALQDGRLDNQPKTVKREGDGSQRKSALRRTPSRTSAPQPQSTRALEASSKPPHATKSEPPEGENLPELPAGWKRKFSQRHRQYYYYRVNSSGSAYESTESGGTKTYWPKQWVEALEQDAAVARQDAAAPNASLTARSSSSTAPGGVRGAEPEASKAIDPRASLGIGRALLDTGLGDALDGLKNIRARTAAAPDPAMTTSILSSAMSALEPSLQASLDLCEELGEADAQAAARRGKRKEGPLGTGQSSSRDAKRKPA